MAWAERAGVQAAQVWDRVHGIAIPYRRLRPCLPPAAMDGPTGGGASTWSCHETWSAPGACRAAIP